MYVDHPTRPVPLSILSGKECCLLASAAERRCVTVLSGLAATLEQSDPKTGKRLRHVAAVEQGHLDHVSEFEREQPWPTVLHLNAAAITHVLRQHLPVLFSEVEPSTMSREAAIDLFRRIEHETSHFYRELGTLSGDLTSRVFCCDMAERESSHSHLFDSVRP